MSTASTSTASLDPWLECEPHLNSRLLEPMLTYYENTYSHQALVELVGELETSLEVLTDPDRWFSAELFQRLIETMVLATGDADLTYRAGRAMARPSMMGPERMLVRGLANPSIAYANIGRISSRLSKITRWEMNIHRRGRATATLVLVDDRLDSLEFCRNRAAVLEAIPEGFGLPPARVDHPACVHRGAPQCVYEVHWVERNPWLQVGWLATGALAVATGVLYWQLPHLAPAALAVTAGVAMLTGVASAFSYRQVERDNRALTRAHVEELAELLERNDRRIAELQAIQSLMAVAASAKRDEDRLVDAVLGDLRTRLDYDRALLLRVHADGARLGRVRSSGFGEASGLVGGLDVSVHPDGADERLFGNILTGGLPMLVRVDDGYEGGLLPHNRDLLQELGSRSFVAAPVIGPPVEDEPQRLGLLIVDRTSDRPLSLRDRDLVSSVATALGTAISNVRHLRRVQDELMINQKFRQYLPPQAVDDIRADPEARLRLGGKARELAIMFTDIAAFTQTSASLDAAEVVRGLNAWFAITDPIIRHYDGIVDKRMGDGILVVFLPETDPVPGRHPVERAASAAREMQTALEALRPKLQEDVPGFAAMKVRHAIHYGSAIVGNMGSQARMEYTVIGDAVNVCARVEELTPAGAIWVTGQAVRAVPGGLDSTFETSETLRGRSEPTELYSVGSRPDASISSAEFLAAETSQAVTVALNEALADDGAAAEAP